MICSKQKQILPNTVTRLGSILLELAVISETVLQVLKNYVPAFSYAKRCLWTRSWTAKGLNTAGKRGTCKIHSRLFIAHCVPQFWLRNWVTPTRYFGWCIWARLSQWCASPHTQHVHADFYEHKVGSSPGALLPRHISMSNPDTWITMNILAPSIWSSGHLSHICSGPSNTQQGQQGGADMKRAWHYSGRLCTSPATRLRQNPLPVSQEGRVETQGNRHLEERNSSGCSSGYNKRHKCKAKRLRHIQAHIRTFSACHTSCSRRQPGSTFI